jgi:hypothetical protein
MFSPEINFLTDRENRNGDTNGPDFSQRHEVIHSERFRQIRELYKKNPWAAIKAYEAHTALRYALKPNEKSEVLTEFEIMRYEVQAEVIIDEMRSNWSAINLDSIAFDTIGQQVEDLLRSDGADSRMIPFHIQMILVLALRKELSDVQPYPMINQEYIVRNFAEFLQNGVDYDTLEQMVTDTIARNGFETTKEAKRPRFTKIVHGAVDHLSSQIDHKTTQGWTQNPQVQIMVLGTAFEQFCERLPTHEIVYDRAQSVAELVLSRDSNAFGYSAEEVQELITLYTDEYGTRYGESDSAVESAAGFSEFIDSHHFDRDGCISSVRADFNPENLENKGSGFKALSKECMEIVSQSNDITGHAENTQVLR